MKTTTRRERDAGTRCRLGHEKDDGISCSELAWDPHTLVPSWAEVVAIEISIVQPATSIEEEIDTFTAADLAEMIELGYPSSALDVRERLEPILDSVEHGVLVARLPNRAVVGLIHVVVSLRLESDRFAELGGFVVSRELRRREIGNQLLAAAEA